MMQKRNNLLLFILLCFSNGIPAQHKYAATIEPVEENGYYHFIVGPELSGYLKTDLGDLRIVDENRRQVPFIIDHPPVKEKYADGAENLEVISKINSFTSTQLVLRNVAARPLADLHIKIRNASAQRTASLSGSDNNKDWFAVIDSFQYHPSPKAGEAETVWSVAFPPSDYPYLKLTINNENKQPLNIIGATTSRLAIQVSENEIFISNPAITFTQKKEGSKTLVYINSEIPFQLNRMILRINSQEFYSRKAELYKGENLSISEEPEGVPDRLLLSSDVDHYNLPLQKTRSLLLVIENGDNPPLKIASVQTQQPYRRVVAYLEKNRKYEMWLDNELAEMPNYDLKEFSDRIPLGTPVKTGELRKLPLIPAAETEVMDKRWIWPVLIAVIGVLGFLAWKLTSEMKRNHHNQQS